MKNLVVSVACIFSILFFYAVSLAEPVRVSVNNPDSDNLESLVKSVKFNGPDVKSLGNLETAKIQNVIPSPAGDDNRNNYCFWYYNTVKIAVPEEGASFYLFFNL